MRCGSGSTRETASTTISPCGSFSKGALSAAICQRIARIAREKLYRRPCIRGLDKDATTEYVLMAAAGATRPLRGCGKVSPTLASSPKLNVLNRGRAAGGTVLPTNAGRMLAIVLCHRLARATAFSIRKRPSIAVDMASRCFHRNLCHARRLPIVRNQCLRVSHGV